jgi:hypothetical protein
MKIYKLLFKYPEYSYDNLITCEEVEHSSISEGDLYCLEHSGFRTSWVMIDINEIYVYVNVTYEGEDSDNNFFQNYKSMVINYNRFNKLNELYEII